MRGRPGNCAAAVLMPGRWVSRTVLQAGHCQKMCSSFFFWLTPEVQRVLKTVLGKVGVSSI